MTPLIAREDVVITHDQTFVMRDRRAMQA